MIYSQNLLQVYDILKENGMNYLVEVSLTG